MSLDEESLIEVWAPEKEKKLEFAKDYIDKGVASWKHVISADEEKIKFFCHNRVSSITENLKKPYFLRTPYQMWNTKGVV